MQIWCSLTIVLAATFGQFGELNPIATLSTEAIAGESFILTFGYSGPSLDTLSYGLTRDGRRVSVDKSRIFEQLGQLYFTEVQQSDAGEYRLTVTGKGGKVYADEVVVLTVTTGSDSLGTSNSQGPLTPELAVLKAIAEEQRDAVKRSATEKELSSMLPAARFSRLLRHFQRLSPEATKQANARSTFERILERARRLVGDIPPLAYFPMLEFAQCTNTTRQYNCTNQEYRPADGSCSSSNTYPLRGASNTAFRRILDAQYEDGIYVPIGANQTVHGNPFIGPWPSPRTVSRRVFRDYVVNTQNFSMMFAVFTQFLGLDLSGIAEFDTDLCSQSCNLTDNLPFCVPILVENDDESYGVNSTNNASCLYITRAAGECLQPLNSTFEESRQQINRVTHYLDASVIYGSSNEDANALRTFRGGKLKQSVQSGSSKGGLPISNVTSPSGTAFFAAGDMRVNNYIHQTVFTTLWYRLHNDIVGRLARINRCWDDEKLYQEGREIVVAILQYITYSEYLPVMFGNQFDTYIGDYSGYNNGVDSSIPNAFATAAFEHDATTFQTFTDLVDKDGVCTDTSPLSLRDSFLNPAQYARGGGTDPLLRGMLRANSRQLDEFLSKVLTTQFLATSVEPLGLDLAAQTIQRARETGVPSYRAWQTYCSNVYGVTSNFSKNTQLDLQSVYGDDGYQNGMDLWVGGIAEQNLPGSNLGATFACIIGETFSNLRLGDSYFWLNNRLNSSQQREIEQVTMAKVICDYADDITEVSPRAFEYAIDDEVRCGSLPSIDLAPWRDSTCPRGGGAHALCECSVLSLSIAFLLFLFAV